MGRWRDHPENPNAVAGWIVRRVSELDADRRRPRTSHQIAGLLGIRASQVDDARALAARR